jgi:hypothetical protein
MRPLRANAARQRTRAIAMRGAAVLLPMGFRAPSVSCTVTGLALAVWMIRTCGPDPARSVPWREYTPVRVLSGTSG